MNLVNCAEKCRYQNDGLCNLPIGACLSLEPTKDCCYFVSVTSKKDEAEQVNKNRQNFA